jgi:hypothetical protein
VLELLRLNVSPEGIVEVFSEMTKLEPADPIDD